MLAVVVQYIKKQTLQRKTAARRRLRLGFGLVIAAAIAVCTAIHISLAATLLL